MGTLFFTVLCYIILENCVTGNNCLNEKGTEIKMVTLQYKVSKNECFDNLNTVPMVSRDKL